MSSTVQEKSENSFGTITEVEVESAEIKEQDLVEIINSIETRLIQEEIKKEIDEKGEPYPYSGVPISEALAIFASTGAFAASLVFSLSMFSLDISLLASISLSSLILLAPNSLSFVVHRKFWKKSTESSDHYFNIQELRKKLLENSLKVEIVSGADELSGKWSEVSAIDGNRALKYLVRILKDEKTGFEQVEVKKFEN